MPEHDRYDGFLQFIAAHQGTPPAVPGVGSWGALAERIRQVPREAVEARFDRVETTYVVDTSTENYESWTEAKRLVANHDAATALQEAKRRGGASTELRNRMFAYTGFGGIRDFGVFPSVYPPEYVTASRMWVDAAKFGTPVEPRYAQIMERVQDQYFTGLDVCRAAWALAQRANPSIKTALETSAGIGRMLRTAPLGIQWTAVEMDTMLAEMVQLCFPEAVVYSSMFERYATSEAASTFDLIIGNPPYGKRPPEMKALDGSGISDAVDYFILRSAKLLNPGGTLVYVVPLSTLTGASHAVMRESLLTTCAFRGAAVIPSGAFPGVREGTFVIMVVTRRHVPAQARDEREDAIVTGDYLRLAEAASSICGGEWRKLSRGEGVYLHGRPDFSRLGELYLTPPPVSSAKAPEKPPPPAQKNHWMTPKKGARLSEITSTIRQQMPHSAWVYSLLASYGLVSFTESVVPVDEMTIQFVWSDRSGYWLGAQVTYDPGPDTYVLVSAAGDKRGVLAVSNPREDVYSEDLNDVDALYPAKVSAVIPTAHAELDLGRVNRPLAKTIHRLLQAHPGAATSLAGGGWVMLSLLGYQDLLLVWCHTTGAPQLGIFHRRDDGLIDLMGCLSLDGTVVFPVVGSRRVTKPTGDAALERTWASNILAQGFTEARLIVGGAPTPDASYLLAQPEAEPRQIESPERGQIVAQTKVKAAVAEAAQTVADAVRGYLKLVVADPAAAERERLGIRAQVMDWIGTNGNPHPAGPPALRAVVTAQGTLEAVLEQPISHHAPASFPDPEASVSEQIGWWCERKGYAMAADLDLRDEDLIQACVNSPDLYIEMRPEGVTAYTRWAYLTGAPAGRLEIIDRFLDMARPEASLKSKLESQKSIILSQWAGAKTIGEIDVSPRSPFVPLACLQEWINTTLGSGEDEQIELMVNEGIMSVDPDSPGVLTAKRKDKLDDLYWLLGYYSRSSKVESLEEAGKEKHFYGQVGLKGREAIDARNCSRFLEWLGESSWVPTIENEYNTKFAPSLISDIPSTPVELAGQNPQVVLHGHQSQGVRRFSLGGHPVPGLLAWDVGAGKTFGGIAIAMRWKQLGAARRPLIVAPTSVLAKWHADATRLFPEAKIGLIGITPGRDAPDNQDTRMEKWLRYASGAYDLCIVGHSSFFLDLEPDEADVVEVLLSIVWARRQVGDKLAKNRRLKAKYDAAVKHLEALKQVDSSRSFRTAMGLKRDVWDWEKKLPGAIGKAEKAVADAAEKLGDAEELGTASVVANTQKSLRELVSTKPYRPEKMSSGELSEDDLIEGPSSLSESDEEDEEDEEADGGEEKPKKRKRKPRDTEPVPGLLRWSDIGCDAIIVDEAHRFKNLWYPAAPIEYAGKGQDELFGVKAPWDMLIKCATIRAKHGGNGGIIFLTATPATNSPLELYSLLTMVAPSVFEDVGIYDKEGFIDRYWQVTTQNVVRPSGKLVEAQALTGFKNLNEMMALMGSVFDKKSSEYLIAAGFLKGLPSAVPQDVRFERDAAQTALIRSLVSILDIWAPKPDLDNGYCVTDETRGKERYLWSVTNGRAVETEIEVIPDDTPDYLTDRDTKYQATNILRLIWIGLLDKISIDPRLVVRYAREIPERYAALHQKVQEYKAWEAGGKVGKRPKRPRYTEEMTLSLASALVELLPLDAVEDYYAQNPVVPKIAACAEYIRGNLYRPGKGRCGAVVFCDPKELHAQIAQAIVAATASLPQDQRVTPDRIRVITGDTPKPERLRISQEFNGSDERAPTIDVVIGTSRAMAEGIDLQRRSCSVHHLDLPWEPATLHQRNGRAVRQGNLMGEVDLRYYLTERTFDGLRFDKVARKAAWWDQMFSGADQTSNPAASAQIGDLDEAILSMVIEDPEELRCRIDAIRTTRLSTLRAEQIEKATTDWRNLNAAFASARASADPQRRDALFQAAAARRDAWRTLHAGFVTDAVEMALRQLNDTNIALDLNTGKVIVPGSVWSIHGKQYRVSDVLVKPQSLLLAVRIFGEWPTNLYAVASLYDAVRSEDWNQAEDFQALVDDASTGAMAYAAADLRPHLTTLGRMWLARQAKLQHTTHIQPISPLFVLPNQAGDHPDLAERVAIFSPDGRTEGNYFNPSSLAATLAANNPRVLAVGDSAAWVAWLKAFRTDRILLPKVERVNYAMHLTGPELGRRAPQAWQDLTYRLFGRRLPAEAIAQRMRLTHEDKAR